MKLKISNDLFFVAYGMLIASTMLSGIGTFSTILHIVDLIAIILLIVLNILNANEIETKSLTVFLPAILIVFISALIVKDYSLLKVLLLMLPCRTLEFNKIIKYDLIVKLIFLTIVMAAYSLGLTDSYITYRADGTIRSSMGFPHPNIFGSYVMGIILEWLYLKQKKIKLINILFVILIATVVDLLANSRTSEICMVIAVIFAYYNQNHNEKDNKLKQALENHSFSILSIISFSSGLLYRTGSKLALAINSLTTGRIALISEFFNVYKISLFGNYIEIIGTRMSHITGKNSWILDNSYSLLLLRYGILAFAIVAFLFYVCLKRANETKNQKIKLVLIIMLFYGLMETGVYKIETNAFLLYFATSFFERKRSKHGQS